MFLSEKELGVLMKVMDKNRDGLLDFNEFFAFI
jgi:Ca2+-binding EF-hand superfamily protein